MRIDVLTLFPRMLDGFLAESILGKGIAANLLSVNVHDLRDWTTDKHRTADDRPFGGGAGMVMKPEPVFAAIEQLQTPGCRRIYLTPDGTPLSPALAQELSRQQASDFAQRPLRGHRPADPRHGHRSGDQHWRLCADQWHARGGRCDRCVGAFYSRCARGRKVIDARILHQQVARLSSIHASRRISRHVRAGSPAFRATTAKSRSGGTRSRWKKPVKFDPIYSNNTAMNPDH